MNKRIVLLSFFILCLIAAALVPFISRFGIGLSYKMDEWNHFATYWSNTISPILLAVSAIGVFITLRQQRELLDHQQTTTNIQRFEMTFFNLMDYKDKLLQSLIVEKQSGAAAFKFLFEYIQVMYESEKKLHGAAKSPEQYLLDIYNDTYRSHELLLSQYFRLIYNILTYMDRNKANIPDMQFYASILRSQSSNYELFLIGVNGLSSYGKPARNFIKEYRITRNFKEHKYATYIEWENILRSNYGA